jgi:hypothetical protein
LEEQKRINEIKEGNFAAKERLVAEHAEAVARIEAEKRELIGKHEREARTLQDKLESA